MHPEPHTGLHVSKNGGRRQGIGANGGVKDESLREALLFRQHGGSPPSCEEGHHNLRLIQAMVTPCTRRIPRMASGVVICSAEAIWGTIIA